MTLCTVTGNHWWSQFIFWSFGSSQSHYAHTVLPLNSSNSWLVGNLYTRIVYYNSLLLALWCGTPCHHICGVTWTIPTFQACTESTLRLGYSWSRRIVTNLLACVLEAYVLTYVSINVHAPLLPCMRDVVSHAVTVFAAWRVDNSHEECPLVPIIVK